MINRLLIFTLKTLHVDCNKKFAIFIETKPPSLYLVGIGLLRQFSCLSLIMVMWFTSMHQIHVLHEWTRFFPLLLSPEMLMTHHCVLHGKVGWSCLKERRDAHLKPCPGSFPIIWSWCCKFQMGFFRPAPLTCSCFMFLKPSLSLIIQSDYLKSKLPVTVFIRLYHSFNFNSNHSTFLCNCWNSFFPFIRCCIFDVFASYIVYVLLFLLYICLTRHHCKLGSPPPLISSIYKGWIK